MKNLMIVLALGMTFGLVACGDDKAATPETPSTDGVKEEAKPVVDEAAGAVKDAADKAKEEAAKH